jgi:hypothetical protein
MEVDLLASFKCHRRQELRINRVPVSFKSLIFLTVFEIIFFNKYDERDCYTSSGSKLNTRNEEIIYALSSSREYAVCLKSGIRKVRGVFK